MYAVPQSVQGRADLGVRCVAGGCAAPWCRALMVGVAGISIEAARPVMPESYRP